MDRTDELLSACIGYIDDIRTIGRMRVCSSICNNLLALIVPKNFVKLLVAAVAASAHCSTSLQLHKHILAVQWLLRTAGATVGTNGPQRLQALFPSLAALPHVALECSKAVLLEFGASISFSQLVAAARSGARHVGVWVQAQQDLNMTPSDMPPAAEALCCWAPGRLFMGFREALEQLQPEQLPDLLLLAFNMPGEQAAKTVLVNVSSTFNLSYQQQRRLQAAVQQLEPVVAQELFSSALQQRKWGAFQGLEDLLNPEGLPASTLLPASAVAATLKTAIQTSDVETARTLVASRAAQQLNAAQTTAALQEAVQRQQAITVLQLLGTFLVPSTAAVTPDTAAVWLHAAVQYDARHAVAKLCQMEAVQQLDAAVITGLLDQTMQQRQLHSVCHLLSALADADRTTRLFRSAVEQQDVHALILLCQSPAAHQLDAATAEGTLQQGIEQGWAGDLLEAVCGLPVITPTSVAKHIVLALQRSDAAAAIHLSCLPAVQLMGSDDVADVLRAALSVAFWQAGSMLQAIRLSPFTLSWQQPAKRLAAAAVEQLLHNAMDQDLGVAPHCNAAHGVHWFTGWLLEHAPQPSGAALVRLITHAVQVQKVWAVQLLCGLAAAKELTAGEAAQLLQAAAEQQKPSAVELPPAAHAAPPVLAELCELLKLRGSSEAVRLIDEAAASKICSVLCSAGQHSAASLVLNERLGLRPSQPGSILPPVAITAPGHDASMGGGWQAAPPPAVEGLGPAVASLSISPGPGRGRAWQDQGHNLRMGYY